MSATTTNGAARSGLNATLADVYGTGLPRDLDAERAVVAAVLAEPGAVARAAEYVRAEDFYDGVCRAVFAAAASLHTGGHPVNLVTVSGTLADRPAGQGPTVSAYDVTALAGRAADVSNVEHYAARVRERAILRDVTGEAVAIARRAADPLTDPFDALDALKGAHDRIAAALPGRAMVSQREAFARLDEYRNRPDEGGSPVRLSALGHLIGAWKPGKLYVGGGRPAMGKSAHAKSEAVHVAKTGRPVAIFSLEMEADEYAERTEAELGREAAEVLPISYHDAPRLTTAELRARLHRLGDELNAAGQPPLGLVVVDYLQLMQGTGDNREQQIASVSRELKVIAREMKVPVLALAQLNREVEHRSGVAGKRPQLSDLRESGAIENDADVILFYYRPHYYGAEHVEVDGQLEYAGSDVDSLCEVIVAKQRRGPNGSAWARFHGPTTAFRDFNQPCPPPPGTQSGLPF